MKCWNMQALSSGIICWTFLTRSSWLALFLLIWTLVKVFWFTRVVILSIPLSTGKSFVLKLVTFDFMFLFTGQLLSPPTCWGSSPPGCARIWLTLSRLTACWVQSSMASGVEEALAMLLWFSRLVFRKQNRKVDNTLQHLLIFPRLILQSGPKISETLIY